MKYCLRLAYKKPTPAHVRRWADAMFVACGSVATYQVAADHPVIGSLIFWGAFIGKLLSNGWYGDDENVK